MKQTSKTIILSISILGILLLAVVALLLFLGMNFNSSSRNTILTQISDNRNSVGGEGLYISSMSNYNTNPSGPSYGRGGNNVAPNNPAPLTYARVQGPIQAPVRPALTYAKVQGPIQAPPRPQPRPRNNLPITALSD